MPNWCENTVTITGSKEDIDNVIEFLKDAESEFSFDRIMPYPEPFWSMDDKARAGKFEPFDVDDGYNSGGYEWCSFNWGSKWPAYEVSRCRLSANEIQYSFDTPWAPPIGVLDELASKMPRLAIEAYYREPGMMFEGERKYANGELETSMERELQSEDCEDEEEIDTDQEDIPENLSPDGEDDGDRPTLPSSSPFSP